jgi:hypothetical protein
VCRATNQHLWFTRSILWLEYSLHDHTKIDNICIDAIIILNSYIAGVKKVRAFFKSPSNFIKEEV